MNSVSIPAKLQRLGGRVNAVMDSSRRRYYTFLAGLTTAAAVTAPTFCAPTMKTIFNKMANIIYDIALYLGAAILLYALVSWILAMKDENAEGQSRAIRYAIVGVALVCFKAFAGPIINSVFS